MRWLGNIVALSIYYTNNFIIKLISGILIFCCVKFQQADRELHFLENQLGKALMNKGFYFLEEENFGILGHPVKNRPSIDPLSALQAFPLLILLSFFQTFSPVNQEET